MFMTSMLLEQTGFPELNFKPRTTTLPKTRTSSLFRVKTADRPSGLFYSTSYVLVLYASIYRYILHDQPSLIDHFQTSGLRSFRSFSVSTRDNLRPFGSLLICKDPTKILRKQRTNPVLLLAPATAIFVVNLVIALRNPWTHTGVLMQPRLRGLGPFNSNLDLGETTGINKMPK